MFDKNKNEAFLSLTVIQIKPIVTTTGKYFTDLYYRFYK